MRTSSGRGWRGTGFRVGGGRGRNVGRGKTCGMGAGGLISSALTVLAQLISARRTRQRADAVKIQGVDSPKTYDLPTVSRVLPISTRSQDRQARNARFLASVIVEKCAGCGICAQVCPTGAIIVDGVAAVDVGRCTGCGQCVAECPQGALVLRKA